jgi:hypothetical protein
VITAQLLVELQRCHWKKYVMLRPVQEPLLACRTLPTEGVPLTDGRAVLTGEDSPGGRFDSAEAMERVTRMTRVTNVVTARV